MKRTEKSYMPTSVKGARLRDLRVQDEQLAIEYKAENSFSIFIVRFRMAARDI